MQHDISGWHRLVHQAITCNAYYDTPCLQYLAQGKSTCLAAFVVLLRSFREGPRLSQHNTIHVQWLDIYAFWFEHLTLSVSRFVSEFRKGGGGGGGGGGGVGCEVKEL